MLWLGRLAQWWIASQGYGRPRDTVGSRPDPNVRRRSPPATLTVLRRLLVNRRYGVTTPAVTQPKSNCVCVVQLAPLSELLSERFTVLTGLDAKRTFFEMFWAFDR